MATLLVKAQTESSQQFMEPRRNNFVIYKKVHSVPPNYMPVIYPKSCKCWQWFCFPAKHYAR